MKKTIRSIISVFMAVAIVFGLAVVTMAAEKPVEVQPYGVSQPTAYAPDSWYTSVHYWACTNYTYSSYIFESTKALTLDVCSPQAFSVEFYYADGNFINSFDAELNDDGSYFCGFQFYDPMIDFDYYFIIRNESGTRIVESVDTYYCFGFTSV